MAKLRFSSSQYRALPNPSGAGKVGFFFARASSVPPDLGEWRDVNPREVKTTSQVYSGIVETLTDEPERFAERNRGLTISAAEVEFDDKRHEVIVTLQDRELHGVVDGGHTLHAVLEVQPEKNGDWPAEVFVKVITGVSVDQIAEIAGGLNTSQQVDLRSLSNLEGHFQSLKQVLKGESYEQKIAYKMNGEQPIDVREILYYLAVFDVSTYSGESHPTALFGRKEGIVRRFAEQARRSGKDSFSILISKAPEILRLRDMIEKQTLAMPGIGRYKAGKNVRVKSETHKKNHLHFIDEKVSGKVSLGWLMPMLGAFRANVEWDSPSGSFSWKVPNDVLLKASIEGLFGTITDIHERENRRPEYVGRNAMAWRTCYDRVRTAILEHELAAIRQRG